MSDQYVSIDEVASDLNVSRGTVWKWVKRYELPTFRFLGERRTFLKREDVDRLRGPIPRDAGKAGAATTLRAA